LQQILYNIREEKKGIKILVSIIIKLIINLKYCDKILLFLFNLRLCFKTENLFGAQFGELDKYIKSQKETLAQRSSFDRCSAFIIFVFSHTRL